MLAVAFFEKERRVSLSAQQELPLNLKQKQSIQFSHFILFTPLSKKHQICLLSFLFCLFLLNFSRMPQTNPSQCQIKNNPAWRHLQISTKKRHSEMTKSKQQTPSKKKLRKQPKKSPLVELLSFFLAKNNNKWTGANKCVSEIAQACTYWFSWSWIPQASKWPFGYQSRFVIGTVHWLEDRQCSLQQAIQDVDRFWHLTKRGILSILSILAPCVGAGDGLRSAGGIAHGFRNGQILQEFGITDWSRQSASDVSRGNIKELK